MPLAVAEAVLAGSITAGDLATLFTRYWKAGYDYAVQTRLREPAMKAAEAVRRGRGRPRIHADDKARQKAWRDRQKEEEEVKPPWEQEVES